MGKGIFNRLWVDPNSQAKKEDKSVEKLTASQVHMPITVNQYTAGAQPTEEFTKYFDGLMSETNFPGPDYYEFNKAIKTLSNQPLSEEQKFQSIFAGFAAQGITTEKLIESAQKYIQVLSDSKVKDFDEEMKDAEKLVSQTENTIANITKENIELNTKIQSNSTRIIELTQDVNTKKTSLAIKRNSFDASFNSMVSKINEDINKFKTYLNAAT